MAESILDYTDTTKDHWETIQQWRIDEGKNFARSRSSQIARMSAGGMKPGSEQWDANLSAIDAGNKKELESQQNSATWGILDRWTNDMKDFYVTATRDRAIPVSKGRDTVTYAPTSQKRQLEKSGQVNPYVESGLSEEDFRGLSTEEFMTLQFGITEGYGDFSDVSGERSKAQEEEGRRQQTAQLQTQQASPWWG